MHMSHGAYGDRIVAPRIHSRVPQTPYLPQSMVRNMCFYRYYYFSGCGHQKTVLFAYCDQAEQVVPTVTTAVNVGKEQLPPRSESFQQEAHKGKRKKGKKNKGCGKSNLRNSETLPAEHASLESAHKPQIPIITSETGSISIIEEHLSVTSPSTSPQLEQTSTHSSSPGITTSTMASLGSFGTTLRSWMSDRGSKETHSSSSWQSVSSVDEVTGTADKSPARSPHRRGGIRENSDESWDLPDSSDILQHLAESSPDINQQHVGTDNRRFASYGSTAADQGEENKENMVVSRDSLDLIEADINALKAEVSRIRGTSSGADCRSAADTLMTAARYQNDSPADELQRAHERTADAPCAVGPEHGEVIPARPRLEDFPVLGLSKYGSATVSNDAGGIDGEPIGTRKPSYARAALAGWKHEIERQSAVSMAKRQEIKTSDGNLTSPSFDSLSHRTIGSPKDTSHGGLGPPTSSTKMVSDAGTGTQSETSTVESPITPKSSRETPSFARPTQSSTRHTVREQRPPALFREASPTKKSVSPGSLRRATEQDSPQGHQKRKSLPGGWVKVDSRLDSPLDDTEAFVPTPKSLTPGNGLSRDSDHIRPTSDKARAVAIPLSNPQQPRQPLKKGSSYMAPTAAVTQRAIATLGQEHTKHSVPRIRASGLQVETALLSCSFASPQSDVSSANSSLPSSILGVRTSSPATSPVTPSDRERRASKLASPRTIQSCSPGAKDKNDSRGQSKIPRAVAHTRVRSNTFAGAPASAREDEEVPHVVANTTSKRRTSHADILQPIIAKLDQEGLWKNKPKSFKICPPVDDRSPQVVLEEVSQSSSVQQASCRPSIAEELRTVGMLARQGMGIRKAIAPHLRNSRATSAASTATDQTIIEVDCRKPAISCEKITVGATILSPQVDYVILQSPSEATPLQKNHSHSTRSTPSSLRATARVFEPIWRPENMVQELRMLSWDGTLDRYSASDDELLPNEVKQSLKTIRDRKKAASPSKTAERRFWGELIHQASRSNSEVRANTQNGKEAEMPRVKDGSPYDVFGGQDLKPVRVADKNTVRWVIEDANGAQKPVAFGRAPPPAVSPEDGFETPVLSPTSDDTSPIASPYSYQQPWNILPVNVQPPGWLGGDGKEIRFIGNGRVPEEDPNMQIHRKAYNLGNGGCGKSRSPPHGAYGGVSEHAQLTTQANKVWPRSRKQWAELAGYPRVPCGNIEYTQVAEVMPYPAHAATACFDCVK